MQSTTGRATRACGAAAIGCVPPPGGKVSVFGRSQPGAAAPARGFTLLELVLVMAILALTAAMVAPSLRDFGRGRGASNCADQIVALTHWAHTQSVARSLTYRFNLNPTARTYWLSVEQDDGTVQSTGEEIGRVFTAPQGVTISWDVPSQSDGQYVRFLPTGRLDPATIQTPTTIRVSDASGHVIEVACYSATEMFHQVTDQERTQR